MMDISLLLDECVAKILFFPFCRLSLHFGNFSWAVRKFHGKFVSNQVVVCIIDFFFPGSLTLFHLSTCLFWAIACCLCYSGSVGEFEVMDGVTPVVAFLVQDCFAYSVTFVPPYEFLVCFSVK
jgi:hypothetical protein